MALLAEEEDKGEGDIQEGARQLVDVTKSISRLKARKTTLLSQTASHGGDVSGGDGTTNSQETSSERSVSLTSTSKCNGYDVGSASQVSDMDDTFYSCPSTLSSLTPDAISPLAPVSTDFTIPSYTQSTGVDLSPFGLSSSSSVSSLSDASICLPPPTSTCGATEKGFHTPADSPNISREIAKGSGRHQTVTAGQYYNGSSVMKQDDRDRQDTGGRTSVELALYSDEHNTSLLGQDGTEIRSNPSGQSPTGMRSRPSGQSTTEHWSEHGSRSSSVVESGTRMTSSQYGTATAATSSLRCSPIRTSLSSGQGGFRTGFKQQNSSEELNSRTSISGHTTNRSHTNAIRKTPRMRQSQKYRTSSYGTRPNLSGQGGNSRTTGSGQGGSSRTTGSGQGGSRTTGSGQGGSRITGSGQQINKRTPKYVQNVEFDFSSPSSSGFSSPTEVIPSPTTTVSYSATSTSSTQSTHHSSTCHTIPSSQSTSVITSQVATSVVLKPREVETWEDLISSEEDNWELKSACVECGSDDVMGDDVKEGGVQTLDKKMIEDAEGFGGEVIGKEGHSEEVEDSANEVERREEGARETGERWPLNRVGGCEQWEMEEWSDDVEVRETKGGTEVVEVSTAVGGKEEEEGEGEGEEEEEEREGEEGREREGVEEEREREEEEEDTVQKPGLSPVTEIRRKEDIAQSEEFSPESAPEEQSVEKEDEQNQDKSDAQGVVGGPTEERCGVSNSPTSTSLGEAERHGGYPLGHPSSSSQDYHDKGLDSATSAVVDKCGVPQVTREVSYFPPCMAWDDGTPLTSRTSSCSTPLTSPTSSCSTPLLPTHSLTSTPLIPTHSPTSSCSTPLIPTHSTPLIPTHFPTSSCSTLLIPTHSLTSSCSTPLTSSSCSTPLIPTHSPTSSCSTPLIPTHSSTSTPTHSPTSSCPLPSLPSSPDTQEEPFIPSTVRRYPPHFFTPQPSGLVGWKNKRSIGLGRGNPVDNPRAFMFPDYPSYYTFPGQPVTFNPPPFVPATQYYSRTWQFMGPHPQ